MKIKSCPFCRKKMVFQRLKKTIQFRGITITYETEAFVCSECGLEAGTIESAGNTQCAIADAFREKKQRLTGSEIKRLREAKGLSQAALADLVQVEEVHVMRWECGLIQSGEVDGLLRAHLERGRR